MEFKWLITFTNLKSIEVEATDMWKAIHHINQTKPLDEIVSVVRLDYHTLDVVMNELHRIENGS